MVFLDNNPTTTTSLRMDKGGLVMQRQWWKVCMVFGDQNKYYRDLYSKQAKFSRIQATRDLNTTQMQKE